MSTDGVDTSRRRFLTAATTVVGAVGAGAVAVPFIASMNPSARAQAAGAPVEADISKLEPGSMMTVEWRGKPVWIISRTEQNLKDLESLNAVLADPNSDLPQQPEYTRNVARSRDAHTEIAVLVGICTHLGCSPTFRPELAPADLGPEWKGGFFCPCHGSRFDLSGRVYKGMPAPSNLVIPKYQFLSESVIQIGEDGGVA
ncbi:MAG: ubiquinol-cytochrome c reductase iron-sulfur subunit [Gammaproteobacteria bacterium]|nr:ubiquinol-cytochrome c reductase iron-sulfur subunit [Gammaproteobacteria bacterium]